MWALPASATSSSRRVRTASRAARALNLTQPVDGALENVVESRQEGGAMAKKKTGAKKRKMKVKDLSAKKGSSVKGGGVGLRRVNAQ